MVDMHIDHTRRDGRLRPGRIVRMDLITAGDRVDLTVDGVLDGDRSRSDLRGPIEGGARLKRPTLLSDNEIGVSRLGNLFGTASETGVIHPATDVFTATVTRHVRMR